MKIEPKPEFNSFDEVYVANNGKGWSRVDKTTVRSVPVDYFEFEDKGEKHTFLKWSGWYELSLLTFQQKYLPATWCNSRYVFKTKTEAERAAKWWPVTLTKAEWLKVCGDRKAKEEAEHSIENCELTIGCVNDGTSTIRDCLYKVQEDEGMMEVDRNILQLVIKNCENRPAALDDKGSCITKLFKQLNLKWSEKC